MTGNILGDKFVVVNFGESHGKCIGVVVDGCPAGLFLTKDDIQKELDVRRSGWSSLTTTRTELDRVEILSGVFNQHTTGAPICMLVWNKDIDTKPYEQLKEIPRPGHADFPAYSKYKGLNDWRGGGRFSARITASFVMAGAVAKRLLKQILNLDVIAYTIEIGGIRAKDIPLSDVMQFRFQNAVRCPDIQTAQLMEKRILEVKKNGDSVGGIVECQTSQLPVGLGEPVFDSLESDLSKALFSIPAVKGVEFGSGFAASRRTGSENNDYFSTLGRRIITDTNNSGGILGGISTGMSLIIRTAFKPTSSISKRQKSVNLNTLEEVQIEVKGRHDPCVVPRAIPIVEAMIAITLADHAIRGGFISPVVLEKR